MEEIFANHMSDKGLISKIQKEPFDKMGKGLVDISQKKTYKCPSYKQVYEMFNITNRQGTANGKKKKKKKKKPGGLLLHSC